MYGRKLFAGLNTLFSILGFSELRLTIWKYFITCEGTEHNLLGLSHSGTFILLGPGDNYYSFITYGSLESASVIFGCSC